MYNKKNDFSIEGSEALKKAFVEECGIKLIADYTVERLSYRYLSPTSDKKTIQSQQSKNPKHFILPSQWGEALEYVKEYFKEDEFKVGDWVTCCTSKILNHPGVGYKEGLTFKIGEIRSESCAFPANRGHGVYFYALRKATPEEILAARTKSFKLGKHIATVTKDKVEIADRGSVTVPECIEWFEKEFVCNDTYSPLGEFTVVENTYTIDIGCVKNIPLKDIEVLYKYLKTL